MCSTNKVCAHKTAEKSCWSLLTDHTAAINSQTVTHPNNNMTQESHMHPQIRTTTHQHTRMCTDMYTKFVQTCNADSKHTHQHTTVSSWSVQKTFCWRCMSEQNATYFKTYRQWLSGDRQWLSGEEGREEGREGWREELRKSTRMLACMWEIKTKKWAQLAMHSNKPNKRTQTHTHNIVTTYDQPQLSDGNKGDSLTYK